jgi:hypothetical protein
MYSFVADHESLKYFVPDFGVLSKVESEVA